MVSDRLDKAIRDALSKSMERVILGMDPAQPGSERTVVTAGLPPGDTLRTADLRQMMQQAMDMLTGPQLPMVVVVSQKEYDNVGPELEKMAEVNGFKVRINSFIPADRFYLIQDPTR